MEPNAVYSYSWIISLTFLSSQKKPHAKILNNLYLYMHAHMHYIHTHTHTQLQHLRGGGLLLQNSATRKMTRSDLLVIYVENKLEDSSMQGALGSGVGWREMKRKNGRFRALYKYKRMINSIITMHKTSGMLGSLSQSLFAANPRDFVSPL